MTIDRYGELVLAQTFREPLTRDDIDAIERAVDGPIVWNHRAKTARESFAAFAPYTELALREHVVSEHGVKFPIVARHRGLDPWLFLDLRAGRRVLARHADSKTVLNLFAYTGSAAICALAHGATTAWNVDFARSSVQVAQRSLVLNALDPACLVTVVEDCLPVMRQLAGLPVKGRGAARPFTLVEARQFDVVFLDPPAFSRGPFGAVDVAHDYPSLFKPALLATAEGGLVIATNHVAEVEAEAWRDVLRRCAAKAGRPLQQIDLLQPDADFPAFDGRPPQKIALCRV
ncbi:MAG: class I SAM-dependent methyltransferase [Planctomycetes bacterium]|nr:class I SAM-dependent methyltransferase [Planctomycetota bacterium]